MFFDEARYKTRLLCLRDEVSQICRSDLVKLGGAYGLLHGAEFAWQSHLACR